MSLLNKLAGFGLFVIFLIFIFPLNAESFDLDEDEYIPDESIFSELVFMEDDIDLYEDSDDFYIFEAADLVIEASPFTELRSVDDIFPNLTQLQKVTAMLRSGLRNSFDNKGSPVIIPCPDSGLNLYNSVIQKDPSIISETLIIIPYNYNRELDLLEIYNALGRIEKIKDQALQLRNGNTFNVFTNTTRLESASNRRAIPDPSPAGDLPYSETMYLRFTDTSIGDLYLRGDIIFSLYGITYDLTNFRDVYYTIFRVMGTESVSIITYLEPVKEGILIYNVSGLSLPSFLVNRMNLAGNINNRVTTLIGWMTEGIRWQETLAFERGMSIRNIHQNNN
ncbi:MAG: hypothetical protein FWD24_02760 [Treponema sp.]|nr:hypothetical protein [Treponema sp.]